MSGKKLKVYLFAFILIVFKIQLFGQTVNLEFDHYTSNEGLSNAHVLAVTQDSRGFIWVGTLNGLNRFDGLNFKVYQFNSNDTNTIPGNVITFLLEDTLKNLWVMTNYNFCCYNRNTDNFSRKIFRANNIIYNDLYISGSFIDSKGFMWIGTTNGIFRFKIYNNPQTHNNIINAERYILNEPDTKDADKSTVYSFVEDKKGFVWACSFSNNLFYFDDKLKTFVAYTIQNPEKKHFTDKQKSMMQDRDGDFFITIDDNGLLVWYRKENKFILYKYDGTDHAPNDNYLIGLFESSDGIIWIGSRNNGGINLFNKKTGTFQYSYHDDEDRYSLNSNKIQVIYQDRLGTIWVGGIDGLNKYFPGNQKFKRYFSKNRPDALSMNSTLCFAEGKNNTIWVGTDGGGLNLLDRNTNKFIHYFHDPLNSNSLSNNAVVSVFEDKDGILYAGTFTGGLSVKSGDKFKNYLPDPSNPYSISDESVWYVMEDSKKNLWVGTLRNGLDLFDRENGKFYTYYFDKSDSTSLIANAILSMFEDSKHNLYISTYNGVSVLDLNKYDFSKHPVKVKFKNLTHNANNNNSLSSNGVFCVNEDNNKNIWIGTMSTGLNKYDPQTGRYTNYSVKDGLPGNAIYSILFDCHNILWLATDKGLAMFNPLTREIRVFDRFDGLQNTNFHGSGLKTRDGQMYFGGPEGFNSFYPDKIKFNTNKPVIIIDGLKIFNKPIKIFEKINNRVILTKDISETKKLTLSYKENFFALDFIALDYSVPVKNQYKYMMVGFDKDWINSGTKHEASYTNLDPGSYTFRVTACNSDGVWNDHYVSLELVIDPPFWETTWFKILGILFFLSLLISFNYFRLLNIRRKNYTLEQLVNTRTHEIKEINEKLRVQRDQLSLINATQSKLFTIIAHDLRNPFHVIAGFTELLINDLNNLPDNKVKKYLDLIYASSVRGNELLENLLQWSRAQTGNISFEPRNLYLSIIADEVLNLLEGTINQKNILIKELINSQIEVFADENMLKTIFRNLISNAIKFSFIGGNISITANNSSKGDFIEIAVSDTGVGIPENTLINLFSIDNTVSTKGTAQEPGTGLGLIICKEFVEKHGGLIRVESKENQGTTFYFTLPGKQ